MFFTQSSDLYHCLSQVWISYAKFELSVDGPDRLAKCRQIFEEANKSMRNCEEKEERLMLLESWRDYEKEFGSDSSRERVSKLLPEKVKKRRKLTAEDGVSKETKFFFIKRENVTVAPEERQDSQCDRENFTFFLLIV